MVMPGWWFITTNCMDGLKSFSRIALTKPRATVDENTGNIVYRARERYIEGWTNWRGKAFARPPFMSPGRVAPPPGAASSPGVTRSATGSTT